MKKYPELEILATTFNRPVFDSRLKKELKPLAPHVETLTFYEICRDIYKARFEKNPPDPSSTEGVLNRLAKDGGEIAQIIEQFGVPFLDREIQWMKELNIITEEQYLRVQREGRGGRQGQVLHQQKRTMILRVFYAYQKLLHDMGIQDYVDLYSRAMEFFRIHPGLHKRYDVVLIDEAQHFAPNWIELMLLLLKPGGDLLLCDDPSQSVYRAFSWKQKGVDVMGRTRWLRVPYRCTRQIFEAAYALIENNPIARQLISESGDQITPLLASEKLRDGRLPEVHQFQKWVTEREFIRERIRGLIYEGYFAHEIAVLHSKKFVLQEFSDLKSQGIVVDELRRQTGMEYKAVFLPRVMDLFDMEPGLTQEEFNTRHQVTCYMAMSRARDLVFLLTEGKWPSLLKPIESKVDWDDHGD